MLVHVRRGGGGWLLLKDKVDDICIFGQLILVCLSASYQNLFSDCNTRANTTSMHEAAATLINLVERCRFLETSWFNCICFISKNLYLWAANSSVSISERSESVLRL